MAIQYYNKTQTDQQAVIIGSRIRTIKTELKTYIDESKLTTEERNKIANFQPSKFLGSFLTPESIPVAGAVAGNYADVDAGTGTKVERWIFDVDTQEFVKSSAKATADTAETTKIKYESNPNTNAFTDLDKSRLDALTDLTPAPNIDSFLQAFNAAMMGPDGV